MLRNIKELIDESIKVKETPIPPRKCECCGKVVTFSDNAINIMMRIHFTVGSSGHKDLPSFQCPEEEHWACCIECLEKVGHACLTEHIVEILKMLHKQKGLIP